MYFAGGFDEVKSFCSNFYWKLDVEDNVFAMLRNNRNNVVASLHSTMTQWRHLFALGRQSREFMQKFWSDRMVVERLIGVYQQ